MEYSILITIIIGSVLSQMLPYFRKVSEGSISSFDLKYAYNTAIAAFWSSVLASPVYLTWTPPEGVADVFVIHLMALLFGFGGYKLQLEGLKYYKLFSKVAEELPAIEDSAPVEEPVVKTVKKKVVKKKVVKKKEE